MKFWIYIVLTRFHFNFKSVDPVSPCLLTQMDYMTELLGIMNLTIAFPRGQDLLDKHLFLRAIVSRDISLDLIIGLPSIKFYDLLPILNTHIKTLDCCEICSTFNQNNITLNLTYRL